jgi:hypothetical protein
VQKNSAPTSPPPAKVERFQQTMKTWLRAQPAQPAGRRQGRPDLRRRRSQPLGRPPGAASPHASGGPTCGPRPSALPATGSAAR